MKDTQETLAAFRNNTEPLSSETLEIELEALHAQLLHIGPRLHVIRSILNSHKPIPEEMLGGI